MLAGRLNRKFTILDPSKEGTYGSIEIEYAPASPAKQFYGQLMAAGGSESFDAQTDRTTQRYTINTRWRNDLSADKRLSHDSVEYQIEAFADPNGRRKEMNISVVVLG